MKKNNTSNFGITNLVNNLNIKNINAGILSDINISENTEYINSGSYIINAALTGSIYGGYPDNKAVALIGPSGVGKTYLMLNAAREAQNMGFNVIWFDSENAVDKNLMRKFGIDTSKVLYFLCGTIEDFTTHVTNITEVILNEKLKNNNLEKFILFLDSAGNLASKKEVDDALSGSEKADMTRAKKFKSLFRIITTRLGAAHIPFIFSNHIYVTQDFISQIKMGGGTGPEYAASIILNINKAKLSDDVDGEKKQTGIIITLQSYKNRYARPEKVKTILYFEKGMNPYIGLEKYLKYTICGIERGTVKELSKKETLEVLTEAYKKQDLDINAYKIDDTHYFYPDKNSRYFYVKHLNKLIKINELYTSEIFTKDVLDAIDKYVQEDFMFKNISFSDIDLELNDMDTTSQE